MERALVAAVVVALAAALAWWLQQRTRREPPTQPTRQEVPTQLDRADFDDGGKPWLVVAFTSDVCDSCAKVLEKLRVLESDEVAVLDISWQRAPDLHRRYSIGLAPTTVVAGPDGVVRAAFVGNASATDLWAAVAEAREPGTSPEPELGRPQRGGGDPA